MTPRQLLVLFCVLNILNFVERGNIASTGVNGRFENQTCAKDLCGSDGQPERDEKGCRDLCGYTGIQGEFGLTNANNGLLSSLFTVGLMVASPPSAHLIKYVHPYTVMALGQGAFAAALLACGFAPSFGALVGFRMLVGAAEPSLTVVAPAYIIETAPEGRRAVWLAAYTLCVPVGTALGYGYGFLFDDTDWRWSFRVQAAVNLPFVLFFIFGARVDLPRGEAGGGDDAGDAAAARKGGEGRSLLRAGAARGTLDATLRGSAALPARLSAASSARATAASGAAGAAAGAAEPATRSVADDVRALLRNRGYVLVVAALSAYWGYFGALAFWGPKSGGALYPEVEDSVDLLFGGVTVVAGVAGTVLGGVLLDRLGCGFRTGAALCAGAAVVGWVFMFAALWTPPGDPQVVPFFVLLTIGLTLLFITVAPSTAAVLCAVPAQARPTAMALSSVLYHVFGDVPSPYYVGAAQDRIADWRITFTAMGPMLLVAAALFAAARACHRGAADASAAAAEPAGIDVPDPRSSGAA